LLEVDVEARIACSPEAPELSSPFGDLLEGRRVERAGLVQRGREAQWRPRTLEAAPLKEVAEWAGEFRRFWDASSARLDVYLQQIQAEENPDDQRS
jgi:hypothetical protein